MKRFWGVLAGLFSSFAAIVYFFSTISPRTAASNVTMWVSYLGLVDLAHAIGPKIIELWSEVFSGPLVNVIITTLLTLVALFFGVVAYASLFLQIEQSLKKNKDNTRE